MSRLRRVFVIALALGARGVAAWDVPEIEVMTQNQYLGADIAGIATAADPIEFNNAVVAALKQIAANKTKNRMEALAEQISGRKPALVGLQEVFRFECDDPYGTGACKDRSIKAAFVDQLSATLDALGRRYKTAATVVNFNVPDPGLPFYLYGSTKPPAFLTLMDRDVILSRRDITATPVDYGCPKPSADGCNYLAALPVETPFGNLTFERGYVGVDATVAGKAYRFVTTHLEVKDPPIPPAIQAFQAAELIGTLAATTPTDKALIVVGDINSSPEDPLVDSVVPPHKQFVEAGYVDAWALRAGDARGFTCCQRENLSNRGSRLSQRIDMIFSMEPPERVRQARVVLGEKVSSHAHGLWPTDHGSVAAVLQFQ